MPWVYGGTRSAVQEKSPDPDFRLDLRGLVPDAVYEVEYFTGERQRLSGRELAKQTIRLDQPRSFQVLRYALLHE